MMNRPHKKIGSRKAQKVRLKNKIWEFSEQTNEDLAKKIQYGPTSLAPGKPNGKTAVKAVGLNNNFFSHRMKGQSLEGNQVLIKDLWLLSPQENLKNMMDSANYRSANILKLFKKPKQDSDYYRDPYIINNFSRKNPARAHPGMPGDHGVEFTGWEAGDSISESSGMMDRPGSGG
jgi:hypothetical protein